MFSSFKKNSKKKKKKKYEMKNYTQDDSHFLVEMIFYHLKILTES